MDRREFMYGAGATASSLIVGGNFSSAVAQDAVDLKGPPMQFPQFTRVPTVEEYLKEVDTLTGKGTPYEKEVDKGNELLKDAGLKGSPYDIANRLSNWRKQNVGSSAEEKAEYSLYTKEWPVRGNPIIMGFFDATGLRKLEGDTTYWCAAFVSWCICRSIGGCDAINYRCSAEQQKAWPYQRGAASAAYRAWGTETTTPKRGDLAVFQRSGWAGHIGFVESVSGDTIYVLGGNQGAQNEYNGGEVNVARFSKTGGGELKFHSFRTSPVLHP